MFFSKSHYWHQISFKVFLGAKIASSQLILVLWLLGWLVFFVLGGFSYSESYWNKNNGPWKQFCIYIVILLNLKK